MSLPAPTGAEAPMTTSQSPMTEEGGVSGRQDAEASFQGRVRPWMLACFGEKISGDCEERNHRFLEEALELVQACGCTASEAHQLVDYTFGRPAGERHQEVGGVMVTLAALCLAQGEEMHECAEGELSRIWTKVDKIRAKQAAKPKHSPLPEHVEIAPSPARAGAEAVRSERLWIADELDNISSDIAPVHDSRGSTDHDILCSAGSLVASLATKLRALPSTKRAAQPAREGGEALAAAHKDTPKEGDRATWVDEASGDTGSAEFHAGDWRERTGQGDALRTGDGEAGPTLADKIEFGAKPCPSGLQVVLDRSDWNVVLAALASTEVSDAQVERFLDECGSVFGDHIDLATRRKLVRDGLLAAQLEDGQRGEVETFDSIAAWCEQTFGPITPERIAERANEEMIELLAEPAKVEEAADVLIVLSRYPGLWGAVQRKMAVNRKREWRLMGDGTGYHVPAASALGRPA